MSNKSDDENNALILMVCLLCVIGLLWFGTYYAGLTFGRGWNYGSNEILLSREKDCVWSKRIETIKKPVTKIIDFFETKED